MPIESNGKEIMVQQNQAKSFVSWLESYVAHEGKKEEGHTWMRAQKGDYILVSSAILQRYKELCRRSGNAPHESLSS
jgi:hypothetical protein